MKKSGQQKYKEYAATAERLTAMEEGPKEIYYHLEARKPPGNQDIETCKKTIESWYEEETFNPSLTETLRFYENGFYEKLKELRTLKSERKQFYESSDENKKILNVICDYPDVVVARIREKKRKHSEKLTLERDLTRPKAKLYEQAKDKIQKYVEKQNEKLAKEAYFFYKHPITVRIGLDYYGGEYIDPPATPPKDIRGIAVFLKKLSFILYPSTPGQSQRVNKISDILKFFYGIPSWYADSDTIRKQIEKDESKEIITFEIRKN